MNYTCSNQEIYSRNPCQLDTEQIYNDLGVTAHLIKKVQIGIVKYKSQMTVSDSQIQAFGAPGWLSRLSVRLGLRS